jgi:hypothetical protein
MAAPAWLTKLLGVGDPLKEITGMVDGLVTTADEKGKVRLELATKLIDAQAAVIVAEAGGSWLSKSWRPITMLSFTAIIVYTNFLGPMFSLHTVPLDERFFTLMERGLLGYVGLRSGEKIFDKLMTGKELKKRAKAALMKE